MPELDKSEQFILLFQRLCTFLQNLFVLLYLTIIYNTNGVARSEALLVIQSPEEAKEIIQ